MLDASVLFRLFKCDAIMALDAGLELHVATQVHNEFSKGGPAERSILKKLKVIPHQVVPGTREWETFCLIRQRFSTRDLGEDESLAVCLAEASRGHLLPFVTFDGKGTADANSQGVVTLGFLELLSWLVELGSLTLTEADTLEELAIVRNGWKRPTNYSGSLHTVEQQLRDRVIATVGEWKARPTRVKRKRER